MPPRAKTTGSKSKRPGFDVMTQETLRPHRPVVRDMDSLLADEDPAIEESSTPDGLATENEPQTAPATEIEDQSPATEHENHPEPTSSQETTSPRNERVVAYVTLKTAISFDQVWLECRSQLPPGSRRGITKSGIFEAILVNFLREHEEMGTSHPVLSQLIAAQQDSGNK